jgi:predicted enzyme related to lactoylglutathione lyase
MNTKFGRTIILVDDYDKAFEFYEKNFFCEKIYDATTPAGQRYLHIAFSKDQGVGIWFLKADTPQQQAIIGHQTVGQPTLVIYTDTIEELYEHVRMNNVPLIGELVLEKESSFFHCLDLYGNKLTIVQLPD